MSSFAQLLTLHLDTGSLSFACTPETARELGATLDTLVERLKAVVDNPKKPQKPVEFRQKGDIDLEVFCNPNIWPTPFAAKVYLTLKTEHLKLSTEASLSQVRDDLSQYLAAVA
jgi:hypothetical protein